MRLAKHRPLDDFNPRSPHGERRRANRFAGYITRFQSTLPARGATRRRGADGVLGDISIHAPRTGSDAIAAGKTLEKAIFQSTLPARGATKRRGAGGNLGSISIHAPRTGSDFITGKRVDADGYFNPRSPHGERPKRRRKSVPAKSFQSTLPARGATGEPPPWAVLDLISIHAPRTGSD